MKQIKKNFVKIEVVLWLIALVGGILMLSNIVTSIKSVSGQPSATPAPVKDKEYRASRDTGLYNSNSAHADQIAIISKGDRIRPTGWAFTCKSDPEGYGIRTCRVTIENGTTGWMLEKLIVSMP